MLSRIVFPTKVWLAISLLFIWRGFAQSSIMTRKDGQQLPFVLSCAIRTAKPPAIDGRLDDDCWQGAAVAKDFVLFGGKGYANDKTEALVLWDNRNLYIGMRCFDPQTQLLKVDATTKDDLVCADDCVEIFLSPPNNSLLAKFPANERYFHLAVNAAGVGWDEIGPNAPDTWDGKWEAKTSVYDNRWEVEIAIPWTELKSKPQHQEIWEVNFNRGRPTRDKVGEYSGWSITFSGFHDLEHFGKLMFLDKWPTAGKKTLEPEAAANLLRKLQLEPLLKKADAELHKAQKQFAELSGKSELQPIREAAAEVVAKMAQTTEHLQGLARETAVNLFAEWENQQGKFREHLKESSALLAKAEYYAGLTLAQLAGREALSPFKVMVVPAITDAQLLPQQMPTKTLPENKLILTACPGEYEPASFGIFALDTTQDVRLVATDLTGDAGKIPAGALDLRVVKVWYQAGTNVGFQNQKLLTPELLLKDDSLVQMDEELRVNVLKMDKDAMRDADTLQPFNVPAQTFKQCWLTLHVPADAKAGKYTGAINITAAGGGAQSLPVEVTVLPFTLDEPKIICSIYYRGRLSDKAPVCNSEMKTEEQLLAELKDMVAHGVTNPTVYQGPGPNLERYFQLRQEAGMHGGPLLFLGGSSPDTVTSVMALAKKYGFTDVYFYGQDERRGDQLRAQRAWYDRIHAAGGKVFVAGYHDSYELMGDVLDLPIFAGRPDVAMGEAYHAMGHLIGSYANPQGGVEKPETYRRNYGFGLWKAGYDCACTYAYQHSFGHSWDDYDNVKYRDHEMAYPTVNGVIPTVQWEGYREGYDDLRYLRTLENMAEKYQRNTDETGEMARAAQLWMRKIDLGKQTPDEVRKEIIARIIALKQAMEK